MGKLHNNDNGGIRRQISAAEKNPRFVIPEVSVAIATYNGSRFIRSQMESIMEAVKSVPSFEIVVSDDGSTDDTISIVKRVCGPKAKILRNSCEHGVVKNIENALRHCNGRYIFLADQDDLWLPGRVSQVLPLLAKKDVVVCDCRIIDQNGGILLDSFFALRNSGPGFLYNLYRNGFLGCCMAIRFNALKYCLPFPPNIAMHDMWIGLLAEVLGSTHFSPECLVLYRRHGNNQSTTGGRSENGLIKKAAIRVRLLATIGLRCARMRLSLRDRPVDHDISNSERMVQRHDE
jgi:glycosyltransferase involved in cell wall biosynthesis